MTIHESSLYLLVAALVVSVATLAVQVASDRHLAAAAMMTAKLAASKIDAAPVSTGPARRAVRGAWKPLGQEKTIALGEKLATTKPLSVTIFCGGPECADIGSDIDDAFQIAGWEGAFSSSVLGDPAENGFLVGPPGPEAETLRAALLTVIAAPVKIVDMRTDTDLGLIVARAPRP